MSHMNIYGTGIDIVEINRIRKAESLNFFSSKVLTIDELNDSYKLGHNRLYSFLAGRFAGKEAVAKAFGVGFGKYLTLKNIEIRNNMLGTPICNIDSAFFKKIGEEKANLDIYLTISHDINYAIASCIVTKKT